MKTIAMYLPQFHRIPENDEWWGEGYTEWTAVKAATSFYEGHVQPKVPLHENYYNLLEKSTMMWQAGLMKEYGIDAQCFYHYYFKDGKKLLEKPAENLLQWKDIDMPFCFCWANESWIRTWSSIAGNSWADKFEQGNDVHTENGMLLEQGYGREEAWKIHFEYLLPFFKDERYIKLNGAPVFLIYQPKDIKCLYQMTECWRKLAVVNGFTDLYLIGMDSSGRQQGLDAVLMCSMRWKNKKEGERRQGILLNDYEEIWNHIISVPPIKGSTTYYEGVVNHDDSPRRGRNGVVFSNFSTEKFKLELSRLYRKSLALGNEFIFINAWNEWGEGMYLEPDEENGYAYLEAVRGAKEIALNSMAEYKEEQSIQTESSPEEHSEDIWKGMLEKSRRSTNCLHHWMILREQGKRIDDYLLKYGIKSIAVYGMGMMGKHFLSEMADSKIEIKYVIDKHSEMHHPKYPIKGPEEELSPVDAVVVTPMGEFEKIYDEMQDRLQSRYFSLEELIYEC